MRSIFVDTSGWANFFLQTEPFHAKSVELLDELRKSRGKAVTTNYVIAELIALLTSPFRIPRRQQVDILDAISAATWADLIRIDHGLHMAAIEVLRIHQDKQGSLVDCSSVVVMKSLGIPAA